MNIPALLDRNMILAGVSAIIYLLLVAGVLVLLRAKIAAAVDVFKSRHRLRPERAAGQGGSSAASETPHVHLSRLLNTTMKRPLTPTAFMALTIALFFAAFIASAKTIPPAAAVVTGAAFAGLPYLFLRTRLERQRRAGSFEGEKLVSAFLTAYLVSGGNMYETMERAIAACPHLKITTKLLADLLHRLRATGDPARARAAADAFAYGVGTSWAAMLAYAIRTGATRGADMTPAIEDILAQLREARALAEERRRINGESVRMTAYLTPALYIGSIAVALAVMGISPARLLYNQFFTAQGFALFACGLFLFLLNRVLLETLTNRKLDF